MNTPQGQKILLSLSVIASQRSISKCRRLVPKTSRLHQLSNLFRGKISI